MEPTIRTFTGREFNLASPTPEQVFIEDIAHALSQLCRFTGHTNQFYSVAQHSVAVSLRVPKEFALWGLLHDAAEAYVGDMSSPLKSICPEYRGIEHNIMAAVCERFGLPYLEPLVVKEADYAECRAEAEMLFVRPEHASVIGWGPVLAKLRFLNRFAELTRC